VFRRTLLVCLVAATACGSDLLLGPDAAQGIDGLALMGPMCPVVRVDDPCPDAPHEAWIRVLSSGGAQVARVRSGTDGRFRVGLAPGTYRVVGESGTPLPRGSEEEVTVTKSVWTPLTLLFDTGIR
jgi:hypothetical protein